MMLSGSNPSQHMRTEALSLEKVAPLSVPQRLTLYKEYLAAQREAVETLHSEGENAKVVCEALCAAFDTLLRTLYIVAVEDHPKLAKVALVANGGYGRGNLYRGSDLDLLFLLPKASHTLPTQLKEGIDAILYPLWDLNLKVGHASRSISENIQEGKKDPITRTTLFDSRLIAGDQSLFADFKKSYRKKAIENDKANFFKERSQDMTSRFEKYSSTVYLQEPNVKESPGGLRDYHNLLWAIDAATGTRELEPLVDQKILSPTGHKQIRKAVLFTMRLRSEMHYRTGKATDLLSLQLQGEIAESFQYPGKSILYKIENLMRDYYTHARNLNRRVTGVFETLDIELNAFQEQGLTSWFPSAAKHHKKGQIADFDGFRSENGLLYAIPGVSFRENRGRILRAFWYCQKFGLNLSPSLRKTLKNRLHLIDRNFRYATKNRETIENIMSMRGNVALTLRAMHRLGILGKFFPEFGALDCLVQHEFFHRFTADEHTLRCIDMLDMIANSTREEHRLYQRLFQKMEAPFALYLALLLHDSGRALNTSDHVDGSNALAAKVCNRLQISGERRRLIMFLIDHHLTLFNVGTKKDIDDPAVIQELCLQVKSQERLDALFVFTYCDSNGTNPDGWSGWKELAISTLYKRASAALMRSTEEEARYVRELLEEQKEQISAFLGSRYEPFIQSHFQEMPAAYFRYRDWRSIACHIKSFYQYANRRVRRPDTPFEAAVQWIDRHSLGLSEVSVVTVDRPNLLASLCCAFAAHHINILSANVHTRTDGLVLDAFRVCNENLEAVSDKVQQLEIVTTIYELNQTNSYDPSRYIKSNSGFLDDEPPPGVSLCYASIDHTMHPTYTMIEVQATDRIGLLQDLLSLFASEKILTKQAHITTERGTAVDNFGVVTAEGEKLSREVSAALHRAIVEIAS